jgi:hypothetical protein
MHSRIAVLGGAACMVAACGLTQAQHQGDGAGAGSKGPPARGDVRIEPLPTVEIAGVMRTRKYPNGRHSAALCAQDTCYLTVSVDAACNANLDPQWLALARAKDAVTLVFELRAPAGGGFTLGSIHEKGKRPGDPSDLFHRQKGQGTDTIEVQVANHFGTTRLYDIEIAKGGSACVILDPPIIPDY